MIKMMKTTINSTWWACAALALSSCLAGCSSDDAVNAHDADIHYINVSPSIKQMSRVTTAESGSQSFTKGDAFSVYAWTGDPNKVPAAAQLVVNNSINTFDGSAWNAAPKMVWQDDKTAHHFLGIYPKRAVTDFTADAYTLVADQTQSDLLVAVQNNVTPTAASIPLQFSHVMAKLVVNLNFRTQWETAPTVTAVKASAKQTATVSYVPVSGTAITATGAQSDCTLPKLDKAAQGYAYSCASIMIPGQTDFKKVNIEIEGKTYTFTHNTTIPLESGKVTTVNLNVGKEKITLDKVSIKDWGTGETIDGGEAEESVN